MQPFSFSQARSVREATAPLPAEPRGPQTAIRDKTQAPTQFVAGGTTLIDLMKLRVMTPTALIDIGPAASAKTGSDQQWSQITTSRQGLHLGAMASMASVADNPIVRKFYPVIAQSLQLAASPQIRNMATLGGNVLQRTRCAYFRDPSFAACNKRNPGSGCSALDGVNRAHAVLGASNDCIATYPGDFAQSLIALDATVSLKSAKGTRSIRFADLHLRPGSTPDIETILAPDELITGFTIPALSWSRRSAYVKVRDRTSYAFALASAAIVLDLTNGKVRDARIALGGLATVPWRARDAERSLIGKPIDEASVMAAADIAFVSVATRRDNVFKVELGRQTLARALLHVAAMEV